MYVYLRVSVTVKFGFGRPSVDSTNIVVMADWAGAGTTHLDVRPHLAALALGVRQAPTEEDEAERPLAAPRASILERARGVHGVRVRHLCVLRLGHPEGALAEGPDERIVLREALRELGRVRLEILMEDHLRLLVGVLGEHGPGRDGASCEEGDLGYGGVGECCAVDGKTGCVEGRWLTEGFKTRAGRAFGAYLLQLLP